MSERSAARRSPIHQPSSSPSPIRRPSRSPSPIRRRSRSPSWIRPRSRSSPPISPRSHSPCPIRPRSHSPSPIRPRSRSPSPNPPRFRASSPMTTDQPFPHKNESPGFLMISRDQFLQLVNGDMLVCDFLQSYENYEEEYITTQKRTLFEIYQDENWLKNMYHPTNIAAVIQKRNELASYKSTDEKSLSGILDPLEILAAKDRIIASYSEILDCYVEKRKDDDSDWKYFCKVESCSNVFLSASSARIHIKFNHRPFINERLEKVKLDLYFENYMKDPNALGKLKQHSLVQEKGKAYFEKTLLEFNIEYIEKFNKKKEKEKSLNNKFKRVEAAQTELNAYYKLMGICHRIVKESEAVQDHSREMFSSANLIVNTQWSVMEIASSSDEQFESQILHLEEQIENLHVSVLTEARTVEQFCTNILKTIVALTKTGSGSTTTVMALDDQETDDVEKPKGS